MTKSIIDISKNVTPTQTGLIIQGELLFEEWREVGDVLRNVDGAIHWWIGDWLNYGERNYGEKYTQALDQTDYELKTLQNDAYVAGKIETSRRREVLSWSHHAEVAGLETDEQDELLDLAERLGLSRNDFRHEVQRYKSRKRFKEPQKLNGKYRIIYADPPWKYGNNMPEYFGEQADHYVLMSLDEICSLSIKELAEEDAVLFLWATSPILEEAFEVVNAWGFQYKSSFVWDKVKHVMGHYNSVRHEILLVCVRGSCQPDIHQLFDSVYSEERTEHSRKPEHFREIIDTIYPNGNRIELFAREKHEGWDTWGNDENVS